LNCNHLLGMKPSPADLRRSIAQASSYHPPGPRRRPQQCLRLRAAATGPFEEDERATTCATCSRPGSDGSDGYASACAIGGAEAPFAGLGRAARPADIGERASAVYQIPRSHSPLRERGAHGVRCVMTAAAQTFVARSPRRAQRGCASSQTCSIGKRASMWAILAGTRPRSSGGGAGDRRSGWPRWRGGPCDDLALRGIAGDPPGKKKTLRLLIAPPLNPHMWGHAATRRIFARLTPMASRVVGPDERRDGRAREAQGGMAGRSRDRRGQADALLASARGDRSFDQAPAVLRPGGAGGHRGTHPRADRPGGATCQSILRKAVMPSRRPRPTRSRS